MFITPKSVVSPKCDKISPFVTILDRQPPQTLWAPRKNNPEHAGTHSDTFVENDIWAFLAKSRQKKKIK